MNAIVGNSSANSLEQGFSLFELVVALAILGALLATAPAAYHDWIASQQLANHARFLAETLEIAQRSDQARVSSQRLQERASTPVRDPRRLGIGLDHVRR